MSDSVRGVPKNLYPNLTNAEDTTNYLSALTSDGFTVQNAPIVNSNASTYVAWCWDAGGTTDPSNEAGSITSQVRANASAGFSVVTYTGNGANATVGHGLGVAPQFLVVKARSASGESWIVYHAGAGMKYGVLNATNAFDSNTGTIWNSTAPTSSVFSLGNNTAVNGNGTTYVCYVFAPVAGYSSFGSYTGNGSATDGPFVYTGLRPRWILIKRSSATENWMLYDAARSSYNASNDILRADISEAELADYTAGDIDLLSNGFKLRGTWTGINASGSTYIYAAFAEHPFATSRAR
jgi:hypothetical protein